MPFPIVTRSIALAGRLAALASVACGDAADPHAPARGQAPVIARATACERTGGTMWGIAGYDELYALKDDAGHPWIFALTPRDAEVARGGVAEALVAAAAAVDPSALPDAARVVLQNDAWGLADRLLARGTSEPPDALLDAAWRWVHRLALPPERLAALDGRAMSPWVAVSLPAGEGWREVGSEMPVLSHENLFGMRRIFRLAQRDEEIALFSQLLAIDTADRVRLTSVAGEIEALRMGPSGAIAARVWEVDRRGVRCEAEVPLAEVDLVAHVPSVGADGFLETFHPPARVADLPCLACHHDTSLQSLPDATLDPGWRWAALIEQAQGRVVRGPAAG